MHDKVQLGLAVAAHHEFGVFPNLFRRFGTILAADEWLIAHTGQHVGRRKRHADVSLEQVGYFIHAWTPEPQVTQNRHDSFADECS
jgi:hypothetical protein